MHDTAYRYCKLFHDQYVSLPNPNEPTSQTILEIGSQNVNGSLRGIFDIHPKRYYCGVDFEQGPGVDEVLEDPYKLPFSNNTFDVVVSSSVFEHSEMFWLLFLEVIRVLKPSGLFYLNAPSNGDFHRWPVDCWRFYPDSGRALVTWARHVGYNTSLLESFIGEQDKDIWNDFVAVFVKDENFKYMYPSRIQDVITDYTNGIVDEYIDDRFKQYEPIPEDRRRILGI